MFSPECEPDGRYKPVQCFAHAHYGTRCWCVDENGRELSGSSVQGGQKPDCTRGKIALSQVLTLIQKAEDHFKYHLQYVMIDRVASDNGLYRLELK